MFYLIRNGSKSVAHLWDGKDTLCRLWSTNLCKFKSSRKYHVNLDSAGKKICQMCQQELNKNSNNDSSVLKANDSEQLLYLVNLLKSKISWRKLKESGDESVRKLIALNEKNDPLLLNPVKDEFYIGCEKILDEIIELSV